MNISKNYGELKVLNDLNLEVKKGEIVSIVGASGAGKTTLLQILGTLDKPNSGNLFINETDITRLNNKKLAAFRNKEIGFIFSIPSVTSRVYGHRKTYVSLHI